MSTVAQQFVPIVFETDQSSLKTYLSSVFFLMRLDHGEMVVGYASDAGANFWKVKKAWKTS